MEQNSREDTLRQWITRETGQPSFSLTPLAGDASFRRYFRLELNGDRRVIMDAPPDKEALTPFIEISQLLSQNQIHTPSIFAKNEDLGFLMLEDFGDELLLESLSADNADEFYPRALDTLHQIQTCPTQSSKIPEFDQAFMIQEMAICPDWFLQKLLGLSLSAQENKIFQSTMHWLSCEIMGLPQVLIHRDYHSRNLMVHQDKLGVIDFQDAMIGPVTYDLVSLLKDCYISWPEERVKTWLLQFQEKSPYLKQWSLNDTQWAFDLCGLQRHLKVLGIFSRLHIRDGKSGYLQYLPRTLNYVVKCAEKYTELQPFITCFTKRFVCHENSHDSCRGQRNATQTHDSCLAKVDDQDQRQTLAGTSSDQTI